GPTMRRSLPTMPMSAGCRSTGWRAKASRRSCAAWVARGCRNRRSLPSWRGPTAFRCSSKSLPKPWWRAAKPRCRQPCMTRSWRLDRTREVKEIAQPAACIGREFDLGLLAAIADRPRAELAAGLERLGAAELVFRRGFGMSARYVFKHALVRDAAYESLLKSR